MKKEDLISEEQLNAFTDGELDAEEENRIFTQSERSAELDTRLCRQRKLKEMVQHAYRDIPEPAARLPRQGRRRRIFGAAIAALLLLAVGVSVGWLGSRTIDPGPEGTRLAAATSAVEQSATYLLHLTSAEPERMRATLLRAQELLGNGNEPEARQVEIIANEGGLDLLRSDKSPFAEEIRNLAERDVLFYACSKAIQRLEEKGVRVTLLPQANDHYSALDRVVLRMQDGWTYEKI